MDSIQCSVEIKYFINHLLGRVDHFLSEKPIFSRICGEESPIHLDVPDVAVDGRDGLGDQVQVVEHVFVIIITRNKNNNLILISITIYSLQLKLNNIYIYA